MGIFNYIFSNELKIYYSENDKLKEIKQEFETYLYLLYEKVSLIIEIKNKYYDIQGRKTGFIKEDEEKFLKKIKEVEEYGRVYDDKNINFYYKRWTNKKLKRIFKILSLELKSKSGIKTEKKNIAEIINYIKKYFKSLENQNEINYLNDFLKNLEEVEKNLYLQLEYLNNIYPIKHWTYELHETIISDNFLNLIESEIFLIFEKKPENSNFNMFPAIISKSIHENSLPMNSVLNNLIQKNIEKIKENKKIKEDEKIEFVICYHARPKQITIPLFPLELKTKSTGFFLDTNKDEAMNIVGRLYNIPKMDIEVFEIKIPKNLFKYAIKDYNDDTAFKNFEMTNSYIFKPTIFPKLNEFYIKGLIIPKIVTPN